MSRDRERRVERWAWRIVSAFVVAILALEELTRPR